MHRTLPRRLVVTKGVIVVAQMQKRNMTEADEVRTFDKGKLELVTLGGVTFGRATVEPGWKWSTCVTPGATVITGSFNFSKAAENSNAEKLLVLKDCPALVEAYSANFRAHEAHSAPYARK